MSHINFENIPDDLLQYIFEYYMIGLRHRINLRKMKELIEFTQAEPRRILKQTDVFIVMQYADVSLAEAVDALNRYQGDILNAIIGLTDVGAAG